MKSEFTNIGCVSCVQMFMLIKHQRSSHLYVSENKQKNTVSVPSSAALSPSSSERKTRRKSSGLILACVSVIWVIIHEGRQMVSGRSHRPQHAVKKGRKHRQAAVMERVFISSHLHHMLQPNGPITGQNPPDFIFCSGHQTSADSSFSKETICCFSLFFISKLKPDGHFLQFYEVK